MSKPRRVFDLSDDKQAIAAARAAVAPLDPPEFEEFQDNKRKSLGSAQVQGVLKQVAREQAAWIEKQYLSFVPTSVSLENVQARVDWLVREGYHHRHVGWSVEVLRQEKVVASRNFDPEQ